MIKKFKLQPVLNCRQVLEAEARQRLADSLEREQSISRQISESRARFHTLCGELDDRQRLDITVAELMLHRARIQGVEERLKNLKRDLERVQQEIIDRRQGLCEASRDKKLLERLKEKFGEERRQFQNRQETILLDEISLHFGKGEL
jgi:flagellar FliJ protein